MRTGDQVWVTKEDGAAKNGWAVYKNWLKGFIGPCGHSYPMAHLARWIARKHDRRFGSSGYAYGELAIPDPFLPEGGVHLDAATPDYLLMAEQLLAERCL